MSNVTAKANAVDHATKPKELTGKDRRTLRAMGHALSPVVQVGKAGLTPGVFRELQGALKAHELIKVQLLGECPLDRAEAAEQISEGTDASVIQTLGKTLLFYKPNLEKPRLSLSLDASGEGSPARSRKAASKGVRPKHKDVKNQRTGASNRRPETRRHTRSSGNKK